MTYHSLLVHVDATEEGESRLANALDLAHRLGAGLIGVGAAAFEPHTEKTLGIFEDTLRGWIDEQVADAATLFHARTAKFPSAVWHAVVKRPVRALVDLSCGADLIFASRTCEVRASEVFAHPDDVVLAAGVPVLMQPPMAAPLDAERIVLGWKNTRETRRVIWDSLPLLKAAEAVHLIRFDEGMETGDGGMAMVEERLRRHGVKVQSTPRPRSARSIADDLQHAADDLGAGLIVAGAYGQSRLRELVLGGVTNELIAESRRYVFFSH